MKRCSVGERTPNLEWDYSLEAPTVDQAGANIFPTMTFGAALGMLSAAKKSVAEKTEWSKDCTNLLASIGVTPGQVISAALRMEFWQGNGSNIRYAELFANSGAATVAAQVYGDLTIGQYIEAGNQGRTLPGVGKLPAAKAVAELNGTRVFLNPMFISPNANSVIDHQATVVHEALHNMTGRTDGSIPTARQIKEKCF